MNARSILSALVLATAASVAAQNEASLPDTRREHIYFETRLAFDVTSNTGVKPAYDVGAGFVAGGLVGIPISSRDSWLIIPYGASTMSVSKP